MARRLTISKLMGAVLAVALLLFFIRERQTKWFAYSLVVGLLAFPYLSAPFLIHRRNGIRLDAIVEPVAIPGPGVSAETAGLIARAIERLGSLGFSVRFTYTQAGVLNAKLKPYAVILENPVGDVAKLIVHEHEGKVRPESNLILFATEFQDGRQVLTIRTNSPTIFAPPRPGYHAFSFPEVRTPALLYSIHKILAQRTVPDGVRIDHLRGGLFAYQQRMTDQNHKKQVETGYYYLDENARLLRPTWKGATLMAWRLIRPFKQIRNELRRRKARRILRELAPELGQSEGNRDENSESIQA